MADHDGGRAWRLQCWSWSGGRWAALLLLVFWYTMCSFLHAGHGIHAGHGMALAVLQLVRRQVGSVAAAR
jgi:hypothetical protein